MEGPASFQKISALAFNKTGDHVALSPNNQKILILNTSSGMDKAAWKVVSLLKQHQELVLCIAWHHASNTIASGGIDHNVYIWTQDASSGVWAPSLVILQQQRAIMSIDWTSDGRNFVLGTGCNFAFIGYFSEDHKWWQTKRLAKHKSTVTCVRVHPSDKYVATAGTDQHIFITPMLGAEQKVEVVAKMAVPAWINSIDWSPDGNTLAVADHACNLRFYNFNSNMEVESKDDLRWSLLPFIAVRFLEKNVVLCAGFDKLPVRFTKNSEGKWEKNKEYKMEDVQGGAVKPKVVKSSIKERASIFEQKSGGGYFTKEIMTKKTEVESPHSNSISCMDIVGDSGMFTTCDVNGHLVFWKC